MADEIIFLIMGKDAAGGGHGYTGGTVSTAGAYRSHEDARKKRDELQEGAKGWSRYEIVPVVLR